MRREDNDVDGDVDCEVGDGGDGEDSDEMRWKSALGSASLTAFWTTSCNPNFMTGENGGFGLGVEAVVAFSVGEYAARSLGESRRFGERLSGVKLSEAAQGVSIKDQ